MCSCYDVFYWYIPHSVASKIFESNVNVMSLPHNPRGRSVSLSLEQHRMGTQYTYPTHKVLMELQYGYSRAHVDVADSQSWAMLVWSMTMSPRLTIVLSEVASIPEVGRAKPIRHVPAIQLLPSRVDGALVQVSLQNIARAPKMGAFTGEICAPMAKEFGLEWVGHEYRSCLMVRSRAVV